MKKVFKFFVSILAILVTLTYPTNINSDDGCNSCCYVNKDDPCCFWGIKTAGLLIGALGAGAIGGLLVVNGNRHHHHSSSGVTGPRGPQGPIGPQGPAGEGFEEVTDVTTIEFEFTPDAPLDTGGGESVTFYVTTPNGMTFNSGPITLPLTASQTYPVEISAPFFEGTYVVGIQLPGGATITTGANISVSMIVDGTPQNDVVVFTVPAGILPSSPSVINTGYPYPNP